MFSVLTTLSSFLSTHLLFSFPSCQHFLDRPLFNFQTTHIQPQSTRNNGTTATATRRRRRNGRIGVHIPSHIHVGSTGKSAHSLNSSPPNTNNNDFPALHFQPLTLYSISPQTRRASTTATLTNWKVVAFIQSRVLRMQRWKSTCAPIGQLSLITCVSNFV